MIYNNFVAWLVIPSLLASAEQKSKVGPLLGVSRCVAIEAKSEKEYPSEHRNIIEPTGRVGEPDHTCHGPVNAISGKHTRSTDPG